MHRFIDGEDRMQQTLLPHSLEDYVSEENPVRVIEVFIDELDLAALGFAGMTPAATGRPAYHPSTLLKIYLYGYLNRLQSSRRLEPEAQRNIELMWLVGRLAPDFKTIADFRKDNGAAIRAVCGQFVRLVVAPAVDDKKPNRSEPGGLRLSEDYLRAGARWVKPRHRARPLPRTLAVQSRCKSSPKGESASPLRRRSRAFRKRSARLPSAVTARFPQGAACSRGVAERR